MDVVQAHFVAVTKKGVFTMTSNSNPSGRRHPTTPTHGSAPSRHHGRHGTDNGVDTMPRSRHHRGRRGGGGRTLALADLKLRQIEDAFLDALLDSHPRRTSALDRLLDDMAATKSGRSDAVVAANLPTPDPDAATRFGRRVESTLLAAVIEHHPRRDCALDRLLSDVEEAEAESVAPTAAHGAWVDDGEENRRAEFDAGCDADFDGLG
jgi:hypothetical protein